MRFWRVVVLFRAAVHKPRQFRIERCELAVHDVLKGPQLVFKTIHPARHAVFETINAFADIVDAFPYLIRRYPHPSKADDYRTARADDRGYDCLIHSLARSRMALSYYGTGWQYQRTKGGSFLWHAQRSDQIADTFVPESARELL